MERLAEIMTAQLRKIPTLDTENTEVGDPPLEATKLGASAGSRLQNLSAAADVSVLVPAHNEEATIEACLRRATRSLLDYGLRPEIILVDDGSTDTTFKRALHFANGGNGQVRILRHGVRRGKGASLATAMKHATGKIAVVLDADLEYAPEEIPPLVEPILGGAYDVVFGSRFLGQSDGMSFFHWVGNRMLTWTTNLLFDGRLSDVMTGHKAFSLDVLRRLGLSESGFGFEVEVAAKSLKTRLRVGEVPISYKKRTEGKSKIRLRDGVRCLIYLVELTRTPERV